MSAVRLVGKVTHPEEEQDRNEAERLDPHGARLDCDIKFQFLCMWTSFQQSNKASLMRELDVLHKKMIIFGI